MWVVAYTNYLYPACWGWINNSYRGKDVSKKMRMSSNLAKRKREEEEPVHWEDEWEGELYSNSSNYVTWNQYGNGEVATFSVQLPVSTVGQSTVSNIGEVEESC